MPTDPNSPATPDMPSERPDGTPEGLPPGLAGAPTTGAPTPPPSVRLALPSEAPQIAALQRRAWLASDWLRGAAAGVDLDQATEVWWQAIQRPPMAHFRVLVAVQPRIGQVADGQQRSEQVVCGFAASGPSDDPDAAEDDLLVAEFHVDEAAQGQGHDDRLMNALADTARADGYRRLTWWVTSTDDGLRRWLTEAGWAPDGAHREVGTDEGDVPVRIKQVRMHTDISQGISQGMSRSGSQRA